MNKRTKKYHEILHAHSYEKGGFDLPIRVTMALYSRWGPGDAFEYRKKPLMSVNMVTMGPAEYVQDGRKGVVAAGQVFLAHKGCDQRFATGKAGFLHKRTVILDGWLLDVLIERTGLKSADVVTPQDPARIALLLRRIYALFRDKPAGFSEASAALAYELIVALAASIAPQQPAVLRRSLEFIGRSLARPIGLADIAAAGGMSLRQCNRVFVRHLGRAPMKFLINQRMAIARGMLLDGAMPVKQVAQRVGYDDPLYFSDQFKKRFGAGPREFRKEGKR